MDDEQVKRLRELADRAQEHGYDRTYWLQRLASACDPAAILALLDERERLMREIRDAYAALGPDAWWMDPPDGGSPTLAEMVAKANEDGRALYAVKKERDRLQDAITGPGGYSECAIKAQAEIAELTAERDEALALLRGARDFIDTTRDPPYPKGADLADRIDALLARREGR